MRKHIATIIALLLLLPTLLPAQKVGLVMSGGGARGLAHIGVIKALEENEIPIDYVTGTSMGAIVAALYAMGYTPDEMIAEMTSEDFRRWYTGTMDKNYMFYFKRNAEVPELLNLHIDIKDTIRLVKPPLQLVNPAPMNMGFLQIFSTSTAACRGNFDNLMVPFRCVASDVYNKKQVVFANGDLGDAVRASMSFPFVFKPIKKDSVLLYDGGIYNNFPRDVMQNEYAPDFIFGSVVSENAPVPDEHDLMSQVKNLIMGRSDYTIPDSVGILLDMNIKDVKLLDFHKIDRVVQYGYDRTLALIDSVRRRVPRHQSRAELAAKRKEFNSRKPQIVFNKVEITGVTPSQAEAIKKEFQRDDEPFSYEDCKKAYFRVLSGNIVASLIPHAVYDEKSNAYTLHLHVELNPAINLKIGGGVSTKVSNQIYLGAHYRNINHFSKEFMLDGQLGKVYNNVQFSGRFDLPTRIPVSLKFITSYSTTDYYNMKYIFSQENSLALNHEREVFAKLKVALPFLTRKKAEIGIGVAEITDEYMPTSIIDLDAPEYDKNKSRLIGASVKFQGNTFDNFAFPTEGSYESLAAQFYLGKEFFTSKNRSISDNDSKSWLQINYKRHEIFNLNRYLSLGAYLQIYYSTRSLSHSYQASMMQAGAFTPTMNTLFNYDPKFRANQFIGVGITPIIKINSFIQVRPSFYAFSPYRKIEEANDGTAFYSKKRFNDFQYIAELNAVGTISTITISGFLNYYSSHSNSFGIGLRIGWFVFNERFFE